MEVKRRACCVHGVSARHVLSIHSYYSLENSQAEQSCRDTSRASLFTPKSYRDGGILGLVPSQLRGAGGIGSQLLPSGGNRLEGRMWGSSRKKGFCIAEWRGRVKKMQQALCRSHRSRMGQRETRRVEFASPTFFKTCSFSKISALCILSPVPVLSFLPQNS